MSFTLNPSLNIGVLSQRLATDRRVKVRDVLSSDSADRLTHCLEQDTPWSLTYYDEKGAGIIEAENLEKIPSAQMAKLQANIYQHALSGFAYVHSLYYQSKAERDREEMPPVLAEFFDFLASDTMLSFIRELLGDESPCWVDPQATRFGPGNFLGYHNDQQHGVNRRCAFVFNFTRKWRPEWNGYLQFYDETGNTPLAWKPDFNTLNIFKLPQPHAVTCVPPFAGAHRYAVSGWYRAP